jgi:hypothetical protein
MAARFLSLWIASGPGVEGHSIKEKATQVMT